MRDGHRTRPAPLTAASATDNVLLVSSMNISRRRREVALAAVFWLGVLISLIVAASAIGLAKRGMPLEGWAGTAQAQVWSWTLLTSPYVLVAWLPVALTAIGAIALLGLPRRAWLALSLVLAVWLLVVLAAVA